MICFTHAAVYVLYLNCVLVCMIFGLMLSVRSTLLRRMRKKHYFHFLYIVVHDVGVVQNVNKPMNCKLHLLIHDTNLGPYPVGTVVDLVVAN